MKKIFIFLISIQVLGCSVKDKAIEGKNNDANTLDPVSIVVESFYRWYLDSVYENGTINFPDVIITKDSIYKLDGTKYIALLNQSGFFSKQFIEEQKSLINECGNYLLTDKGRKEYREAGFMAVESKACDFMNYFPWIGGQGEEIHKVEIISSTIKENKAKVIVKAIDKVNVELVKEKDLWKINKIYIK